VIALRSSPESKALLQAVWDAGPFDNYIWNDQAGLMKALGWNLEPFPRGIRLEKPTEHYQQISWLPPEWNVVVSIEGENPHRSPRIFHWAGLKDNRIEAMTAAAAKYKRLLARDNS
jgi:hypothetical protein